MLCATLLLANFSKALVPKQVVKHGLMTFISEIAEPTESNVCFLFFEKMVLAVLDEKKSFEEAVNLALTQDFTHAQVKGRCQKTYKVVMEKFSNQADVRSKVKICENPFIFNTLSNRLNGTKFFSLYG